MAIFNEKGTIVNKSDVQTGTNRNGESWQKQSIVLEVIEGNFLSKLAIEAMNERVQLLAPFNEGNKVEVGFVVRSRDYNGKWYSDIKLVGIRREGDRPAPRQATPAPAPSPASEDNLNDDLPF